MRGTYITYGCPSMRAQDARLVGKSRAALKDFALLKIGEMPPGGRWAIADRKGVLLFRLEEIDGRLCECAPKFGEREIIKKY